MKAEQNDLLTRVGPGTACGAVLRQYWQPVAWWTNSTPGWTRGWSGDR
jgi:hypothetical protein